MENRGFDNTITRLEVDLRFMSEQEESFSSLDWGSQEGVLITGTEALVFLDLLKGSKLGNPTKREYYAISILSTIISSPMYQNLSVDSCINTAVEIADKLLEKLSK